MTTATDTSEIEQNRRLRAENVDLISRCSELREQLNDLRKQLAKAQFVSTYDLPSDVLQALTILLPGWPAARWRELTRLLDEEAAR